MIELANEILDFFYIDFGNTSSQISVKSIDEFISQPQYINTLDLVVLTKTISILKNEGLLLTVGVLPHGNIPFNNELLAAPNFDKIKAEYGSYNFLINGFPSIAETFSDSVRPITIKKKDGTPDIGTGFLLGNHCTLITAKHVVENAELITITNTVGQIAIVDEVIFSEQENVDVAIIHINDTSFEGNKAFRFEDSQILENILTIGYPQIPGFDAFQLYEIASINNSFKFSKGQIIGKKESYLDSIEYLIINAKVKGGNSGSPVINRMGNVVGIIVQIPNDSEDLNKLDKLGYGVVTPKSEIIKIMNNYEKQESIKVHKCENIDGGFRILY